MKKVAKEEGVDLAGVEVINPKESDKLKEYAEKLFELRKHKGISLEDAEKMLLDPLYFAGLMVKNGDADGYVAGAVKYYSGYFLDLHSKLLRLLLEFR